MGMLHTVLVKAGMVVPTAAELFAKGAPISVTALAMSKATPALSFAPIAKAGLKLVSKTMLGADVTTSEGIIAVSKAITKKIVESAAEKPVAESAPQPDVADPLAE